ncbi:TPA: hypothetical protein ACTPQP_003802, partial [Salmonella enterica]
MMINIRRSRHEEGEKLIAIWRRSVDATHDFLSNAQTDGLLHLSDAWQFMAGVLPATLRAVAAQRSNPLPADLSSSGECSP